MKEIFLIDAYLNTEKSKIVFRESMTRVKEAGFKICLITNLRPDADILSFVDYCFFEDENRIFSTEFEEYPNIMITARRNGVTLISESDHKQKHSLSVHVNLYRGMEILKSLGYTHFYRMEYDGLIDPNEYQKVRDLPKTLEGKRALFYRDKKNMHIFYHLWFAEIEWMLEAMTPIRTEEDFVKRVTELAGKKKFLPAEEYLSLDLAHRYDEVLLLDTVDNSINFEFPLSRWNNVISDHTNEKFKKGFYGGIFRIGRETEQGVHIRGDKGAVVAWNLNSPDSNWTEVIFYNKEGGVDSSLKLELEQGEGWKAQFFEFTEDCEVEVRLSNGENYAFLLCKNFLKKTRDTIYLNEDSSDQPGSSPDPA
jgi:hypothetical protein